MPAVGGGLGPGRAGPVRSACCLLVLLALPLVLRPRCLGWLVVPATALLVLLVLVVVVVLMLMPSEPARTSVQLQWVLCKLCMLPPQRGRCPCRLGWLHSLGPCSRPRRSVQGGWPPGRGLAGSARPAKPLPQRRQQRLPARGRRRNLLEWQSRTGCTTAGLGRSWQAQQAGRFAHVGNVNVARRLCYSCCCLCIRARACRCTCFRPRCCSSGGCSPVATSCSGVLQAGGRMAARLQAPQQRLLLLHRVRLWCNLPHFKSLLLHCCSLCLGPIPVQCCCPHESLRSCSCTPCLLQLARLLDLLLLVWLLPHRCHSQLPIQSLQGGLKLPLQLRVGTAAQLD